MCFFIIQHLVVTSFLTTFQRLLQFHVGYCRHQFHLYKFFFQQIVDDIVIVHTYAPDIDSKSNHNNDDGDNVLLFFFFALVLRAPSSWIAFIWFYWNYNTYAPYNISRLHIYVHILCIFCLVFFYYLCNNFSFLFFSLLSVPLVW